MPPGLAAQPIETAQLSLFDEPPLALALALSVAPGVAAPTPPVTSATLRNSLGAEAPLAKTSPAETPPAESPPAEFRHPAAQRDVLLRGHLVAYALRRSRRRSIGFAVGADGLAVSAPRWVGVAEIEAALRDKSAWILRKLQEQRERASRIQQNKVQWRDGVTIPFLGEPVVVLLDPRTTGAVLHTATQPAQTPPGADGAAPRQAGAGRHTLRLGLPHSAAPEQMRDAVQSWLQRQARRIFEERCALLAPRLGVRVRRLALSSAVTRWGSASADGSIRLNWRLVHFALPVIDYVVTHELAHLREMNHSPAFWDVVRTAMPDYEAARGTLRHELLPAFE